MFQNFVSLCLFGGIFILVTITVPNKAQDYNVLEVENKPGFVSDVIRSRTPVVAFFHSKSKCSSCKWSLIPMLRNVARREENLLFAFIDLDIVDVQGAQKISTIPTTKIYYNGKEVLYPVEGVNRGPMLKLIKEASKL